MKSLERSHQDRIESLEALDYNPREAAFLYLAAVHSGFFMRRQYCEFLGKEVGGTAAQIIEKVLAKKHAKASTWERNTKVYHLHARPFYAGLGQVDNRNRRSRPVAAIKRKLMALDFVLAHRDNLYLATEGDKADYFVNALGLDRSNLPIKRYSSRYSTATTTRCFVDKLPIFFSKPRGSEASPVVSFCYIDEGSAGLSGFETYLAQYALLLSELARFEVVYVASRALHFERAQRIFEQFCGRVKGAKGLALDPPTERLLRHFQARFFYETKQFDGFDREKLIRLREERREFSGDENEALYLLWRREGDAAVLEKRGTPATIPALRGSFSTYLVEDDYGFLGGFSGAVDEGNDRKKNRQLGRTEMSAQVSDSLSGVSS